MVKTGVFYNDEIRMTNDETMFFEGLQNIVSSFVIRSFIVE